MKHTIGTVAQSTFRRALPRPSEPEATGLIGRLRAAVVDRRDADTEALAASGELLVARVRLAFVAVLLLMHALPGVTSDTRRVTLPLTLVALAVAGLFCFLAARRPLPWAQSFASSATDVTLVTCGLGAFLVLDLPHAALNSRTVFELYFIAIACAGLRYNPQACAMTGLLALGQYGAIAVYGASRWGLAGHRDGMLREGPVDWSTQAARLILLGVAALVTALIVMRAQGLRERSDTDRLTGLANRPAFDERLALEAGRARRYGRPFAIALVDVDHFKRINDTYGHAEGDLVLRAVAAVIEQAHRTTDVAARLGGDEFAVLLPETTAELMADRLESLRRQVADAPILDGAGQADGPVRVTVSIGLANWPDDGETPEAVLATADLRLYEAKRLGRDRLVGAPPTWEAVAGPAGAFTPRRER